MRNLFAIYTIGCIAGGCTGAPHQLYLAALALAITTGLWCEHRREKRSGRNGKTKNTNA